eukprot:471159-Pleurochrysis_carterae.AAC.1
MKENVEHQSNMARRAHASILDDMQIIRQSTKASTTPVNSMDLGASIQTWQILLHVHAIISFSDSNMTSQLV